MLWGKRAIAADVWRHQLNYRCIWRLVVILTGGVSLVTLITTNPFFLENLLFCFLDFAMGVMGKGKRLLTGHATVEIAIEGMKQGAADFLIKPCETEDLLSKINKAYDKKAEHEERIRDAKVKEFISSPRSALKGN